jgi:hypothetical protein
MEENVCINASTNPLLINTSVAGAVGCVRFNNNKGYPYQGPGNPFQITAGAGTTIFVEPPLNNYPQPLLTGTTVAPAPCN